MQDTPLCWGVSLAGETCAQGTCLVADHLAPRIERIARAPFVCSGDRCVQDHPRQPDDGEWECAEGTGVTVCRGGLPAAGVSAALPERGWVCGATRAADAGSFPKVCVDFSPDAPERAPRPGESWSCRYVYAANLPRRECVSSPATRAGDRCASGACPRGTQCIGERCLPLQPDVSCFFDHDCGAQGACIFGTCRAS